MKITQEHYEVIRDAVSPLHNEKLLKEYIDAGMSERRYLMDLVWRAGLTSWICDNVYRYANDDHVHTAVKKAVRECAE